MHVKQLHVCGISFKDRSWYISVACSGKFALKADSSSAFAGMVVAVEAVR